MERWGKRLFSAFAQALHDKSALFSTIVRMFRALQRVGVNVTPNHFYWPIPDLAELEKREWPTFEGPARCPFRLERQLELAREFAKLYGAECGFDSRRRRFIPPRERLFRILRCRSCLLYGAALEASPHTRDWFRIQFPNYGRCTPCQHGKGWRCRRINLDRPTA
jgi:hypothetical protein